LVGVLIVMLTPKWNFEDVVSKADSFFGLIRLSNQRSGM